MRVRIAEDCEAARGRVIVEPVSDTGCLSGVAIPFSEKVGS